jgi:hypothetical protein
MKADTATVARHRSALASAKEHRVVVKKNAEREFSETCKGADKVFADAIKRARKEDVSWRDIEEATGISRQSLGALVRNGRS